MVDSGRLCTSCDTPLPEAAAFCPACGAPTPTDVRQEFGSRFQERLSAALAERYHIERELGRGGMAVVFLAQDLKHDRPVALKVMRPELAATLGATRFLREIQIAAKLSHPHVLMLIDSGEADGFLFYVMPYVEGESLRQRLTRERQLPLEDALCIAREVADGLGFAHNQGIIHRDIKPENILLSGGHAVIADFGIARAVSVAGGTLTTTGGAIGTPLYMSPEQASGVQQVDARTDIYSLGCVLYEMLAGEPPFTGTSVQALIAKHALDPVPRVRTVRDTVPEPLEQLLYRALAKLPADRFATAGELVEALHAAGMAVTPWPAPSGPLPATMPVPAPRRRRRLMAGALATAVVAVAAVLIALNLLRSPPLDDDLIAMLPFTVEGGDNAVHRFAETVPALAFQQLADKAWRAVDVGTLRAAVSDVVGDAVATPTVAQARDVARRVGAGLVLLGQVAGARSPVRVAGTLYRVADGEQRAYQALDAPLDSLDTSAARVLALLLAEEGGEPAHRIPRFAAYDTEIVLAYLSVLRRGGDEMGPRLRELLRRDSTFVYAGLAAMERGLGVGDSGGDLLWRARDRMGPEDRAFLEAELGPRFGMADNGAQRIELWRRAAVAAPLWWAPMLRYAQDLTTLGQLASVADWRLRAEEAARAAWELSNATSFDAAWHSFWLAALDRDVGRATRWLAACERANSREEPWLRWQLAALQGDSVALARVGWRRPFEWYLLTFTLATGRGAREAGEGILAHELEMGATGSGTNWGAALRVWTRTAFWDERGDLRRFLEGWNTVWSLDHRALFGEDLDPVYSGWYPLRLILYHDVRSAAREGEAEGYFANQERQAVRLLSRIVSPDTVPKPDDNVIGVARCWLSQYRLSMGDTTGVRGSVAFLRDLERRARLGQLPGVDGANNFVVCPELLNALLVRALHGDLRTAARRLDSVLRPFPLPPGGLFAVAMDETQKHDNVRFVDNLLAARLLAEAGDTVAALAAARRRIVGQQTIWMSVSSGTHRHLREEARFAAAVGDTAGARRAYEHYLGIRPERPDHPPWAAQWDSVQAEYAALKRR